MDHGMKMANCSTMLIIKMMKRKDYIKYGQMRFQINYKNDIRQGLYQEWHDNGQLFCQLNYKDHKLDELCQQWYYDGKLMSVF
jgi:antitoxin component YwqK of YwqJK toxin-antitoxin module